MRFITAPLSGVYIIEPEIHKDDRGYFFESYHRQKFVDAGISDDFVQDNQSLSSRGTIRGLHFQKEPHGQSKLVRVLNGSVYDVVVDIRPESETFGRWFGINLTAEKNNMMYIPVGFAHGFCVTSETAIFAYKCGELYNQEAETGIRYNDPDFNISWPVNKSEIVVSDKDLKLPTFRELKKEMGW